MLVQGRRAGIRRVVDERTIAFPSFDGNGMYLSTGNVLRNPNVGLLFIDFEGQKRLLLNGIAFIDAQDALLSTYTEAQFVVRVRVTEVFPNCPRYIHRMQFVERSRFVPERGCDTPVPDWTRRPWARDVLAKDDPARQDEPKD
jgi:uncharacterized protein